MDSFPKQSGQLKLFKSCLLIIFVLLLCLEKEPNRETRFGEVYAFCNIRSLVTRQALRHIRPFIPTPPHSLVLYLHTYYICMLRVTLTKTAFKKKHALSMYVCQVFTFRPGRGILPLRCLSDILYPNNLNKPKIILKKKRNLYSWFHIKG